MVPTRLVYYGLFTGTLALFSSGLFTTGLEYQRMEIATVIILTLPAALVLVLPVDVTSSIPGGTWEIGRFYEITAAPSEFYSCSRYLILLLRESRTKAENTR